jgi:hypothetical protein
MKPFYLLDEFHTIRGDDYTKWLGRIVQHHDNPYFDFTPEIPGECAKVDIRDDDGISNVDRTIRSAQSLKIRADLESMLHFSEHEAVTENPRFESPQVRCVRIQQEASVFRKLREVPEVREKLDEWKPSKRRPVYFIAGILIGNRVKYHVSASSTNSFEITGKLPAKTIAQAITGTPLPPLPLFEAGATKTKSSSQGGGETLTGTRIFAIEYRAIRRSKVPMVSNLIIEPRSYLSDRTFENQEQRLEETAANAAKEPSFELDDYPVSELVGFEDRCFTVGVNDENAG